ncbi:LPS biosynthesis protein [Arenimonas soli]|uniref:LPS biosynthesis protein n=1 Tax=Arenimonas soli TaxID=2269504 RepID=A0ABQ1HHB1_9GAMM|nr:lipopolysaccharide biosynthesis protein [Arenimonas soli]GGA75115.1 LPS biosynthesis protein [Arenimonas soli]
MAPLWLLAMLSLAGGFGLALGWRAWARHRGVVDAPDERRLHATPTPRGGGIGIAIVLLAAAPWLGQGSAWFAAGLVLCAGAGLVDDLRPLSPLAKGLLQAAGAACLAVAYPLWPDLWGAAVGHVLAGVVVLVMVNFWNFMDGSNGLAASQALFAALGLAALAPTLAPAAWLAVALAASCLGFLPLNFPRARLFLGDVGSHALGFAIAALLLMVAGTSGGSPWLLVLPVSAMVLDASLTLLSRARRRQVLWRAHREHLYQRAVAHGWSHAGICALYAAWTLAATGLALWLARQPAPWAMAGSGMALGFGIIAYSLLGRAWPRPAATGRTPHGSPTG